MRNSSSTTPFSEQRRGSGAGRPRRGSSGSRARRDPRARRRGAGRRARPPRRRRAAGVDGLGGVEQDQRCSGASNSGASNGNLPLRLIITATGSGAEAGRLAQRRAARGRGPAPVALGARRSQSRRGSRRAPCASAWNSLLVAVAADRLERPPSVTRPSSVATMFTNSRGRSARSSAASCSPARRAIRRDAGGRTCGRPYPARAILRPWPTCTTRARASCRTASTPAGSPTASRRAHGSRQRSRPDDAAFIERMDMFFLATADAARPPAVLLQGRRSRASCTSRRAHDRLPQLRRQRHVPVDGQRRRQPARRDPVHRLHRPARRGACASTARSRRVTEDDPLIGRWPEAQLVVRVAVREVFPNCPRYIHRMELRRAIASSSRTPVSRRRCRTGSDRDWAKRRAAGPARNPQRRPPGRACSEATLAAICLHALA